MTTVNRAAAVDIAATSALPPSATCRVCGARLTRTFVDLGMSPLCETYPARGELNRMEAFYPLHVYVCDACLLVQLEEYVSPTQIFSEYPYFSSYSDSWLRHAQSYVDAMIRRLDLDSGSLVVELGSNDGYLLQYFRDAGIPVLGVEPAANVAQAASDKGIPTRVEFFGEATARSMVAEGIRPQLIVGNNVLAQVPDLNGFVVGIEVLLAPTGTATLEFPHVVRLVDGNQFDTIYHEHFSYFSFLAVEQILKTHGLVVFDVEELRSHGGSLRIYVCHAGDQGKPIGARVRDLRAREEEAGLRDPQYYESFGTKVEETKRKLLDFLIRAKRAGKSIAGYGAPGKGNTLLNYCGIRTDFVDYTVDRNPYKQGRYLPGTHIPIHHPDRIAQARPDFVLILPWNLKDEILDQLAYVRDWGGRFVVPIPEVMVY
jgi:SAM-dependent methyltransferase